MAWLAALAPSTATAGAAGAAGAAAPALSAAPASLGTFAAPAAGAAGLSPATVAAPTIGPTVASAGTAPGFFSTAANYLRSPEGQDAMAKDQAASIPGRQASAEAASRSASTAAEGMKFAGGGGAQPLQRSEPIRMASTYDPNFLRRFSRR